MTWRVIILIALLISSAIPGLGLYGDTSANRHHETMRFINEQVRIEQHMIERYGIKYWQTTGQCTMSRTPMSERSFLSDPHLAGHLTLAERKAAHDVMRDAEFMLRVVTSHFQDVGYDRREARDMTWRVHNTYVASGMYMTSGEWIGTGVAGALFMSAGSHLMGSQMIGAANNAMQAANHAGKVAPQGVDGWMPRQLTPSEAAAKIVNANRIGSGELRDAYHLAGSFLTENQLAAGQTFVLQGKTGVTTILQVPGAVNDKMGIFEFIISPSGVVTHQVFKPGGIIDGMPN